MDMDLDNRLRQQIFIQHSSYYYNNNNIDNNYNSTSCNFDNLKAIASYYSLKLQYQQDFQTLTLNENYYSKADQQIKDNIKKLTYKEIFDIVTSYEKSLQTLTAQSKDTNQLQQKINDLSNQNQHLNQQYTQTQNSLNDNIYAYEKQVNQLNKELKTLKEQNTQQLNQLKEKNQIIQQNQGEQDSMKNANNVLKSNYDNELLKTIQLKQANEVTTKQLDSLQKEKTNILTQLENYCDLQNKYDSLKNEKEKEINRLNEDNNNQQQKKKEIEEELQVLKYEKDQLNEYVPQKDESQYGYDIIVKMKSIRDLQIYHQESDQQKGGLQVYKYNQNQNSSFQNVLIVGMQGQRNKGKTFVLNSLIDQDFPSEFHVSTPGICLKHYSQEGKNIVYVDSEGLNCPISINYKENIHYKKFMENKLNNFNNPIDVTSEQNLEQDIAEKHWDLKATEQIQQEFILQSSNIVIIVVSYLTLDDQKLIHTLSQRFVNDKKNPNKKQLFVVHNLKEYCKPEYVKTYFEELKNIFPVREISYNQIKKLYDDENNFILCDNIKPHISHIVMANQKSDAGRVYNRFALNYLRHSIEIHQGDANFDIQSRLKEYLNKHLRSFVTLKKESGEETQMTPDQNVLEYNEEKQCMFLKPGWQIERIKELQVNVFGSLERDCSYSLVNVDNKDERILLIEITGSSTYKSKFEKKTGLFTIIIDQNNKIESGYGKDLYVTTRKFEEKIYTIQICKENENWFFDRNRTQNLNNGLVKFVFTKEEDEDFD